MTAEQAKLSGQATHVYVAYKPCGCWSMIVNDIPDDPKWVAREIAKAIRWRLKVQRYSFEEYRKLELTCSLKCPHGAQQGELFAGDK